MKQIEVMIGASCRITHQNANNPTDVEQAFGIKESEKGGYREVYLAKEGNTGKLYLGIGGNQHMLIAELSDVAKQTLIAFLNAQKE